MRQFSSMFLTGVCLFASLVNIACSKKADSATAEVGFSAEKPSAIVDVVATGIVAVGGGLSGSGAAGVMAVQSKSSGLGKVNALFTSSSCDVHGYPASNNQGDADYPATLAYCFMTVDSGDTIRGGFSLAKGISCALEKAGVRFDGVTRATTIDTNDTTCFGDGGGNGSFTANVTGSSPAAFNANFSRGVSISIDSIGLTFKIASTVSNGKVSFETQEEWTDLSAGATSGSLDLTTGDLRYESRVERFPCSTSSRCGWNRHTRVYAKLAMSGNQPTGVNSISMAYTNIYTDALGAQSGKGGLLVTVDGDFTQGVKARLWQATNGSGGAVSSMSQLNTPANWVETLNSKCYLSGSDSGTGCGAGASGFSTNTKFALQESGYTIYSSWFNNLSPLTFTSVSTDSDTQ